MPDQVEPRWPAAYAAHRVKGQPIGPFLFKGAQTLPNDVDPEMLETEIYVPESACKQEREEAGRKAIRDLVDGWAEGELCPAAQETAEAIADKARKQERERLLKELAETFEAAAAEKKGRPFNEAKGIQKAAAECRMRLAALEDSDV